MAKKRKPAKPAGPDDPIYQQGLTIYTPMSARTGRLAQHDLARLGRHIAEAAESGTQFAAL